MIVCICANVNEGKIIEALDSGCSSFEEMCSSTGVSTDCGLCTQIAQKIVNDYHITSISSPRFVTA